MNAESVGETPPTAETESPKAATTAAAAGSPADRPGSNKRPAVPQYVLNFKKRKKGLGRTRKKTSFDWAGYREAQARESAVSLPATTASEPKPKSPLKKQLKKDNAKLAKENAKLKANEEENKKGLKSLAKVAKENARLKAKEEENEKEIKMLREQNKILEAENEELIEKLVLSIDPRDLAKLKSTDTGA